MSEKDSSSRNRAALEVLLVFLRLGAISFGGPAAHVALMEDELVRRRGWLGREELLDLLGAANLIPGPNSTELALHVGYRRAGGLGLVAAGLGFIAPAALLVTGFAAAYQRWGGFPAAVAVLDGVKAALIAVVTQALVGLARTAVKDVRLGVLGVAALAASVLGVDELVVLIAAGVLAALVGRRAPPALSLAVLSPLPLTIGAAPAVGLTAAVPAVGLPALFVAFVKIGSLVFGSGYVLLAFLRSELVIGRGWLSESTLLDAVAIGQVTPGPVFTAATFIGYTLAGLPGAVVATVAIFLPAFVLVALSGPLVPRLRRSPFAAAFLDGVNVASLALMALVTARLGRAALVDGPSVLLALAGAVALFSRRVGAGWVVLVAALVGLLVRT